MNPLPSRRKNRQEELPLGPMALSWQGLGLTLLFVTLHFPHSGLAPFTGHKWQPQ